VTQYVFFFGGGKADGNKDMKDTLGGKGAGLAEMTNAGLPVPPGFTISTDACNLYYEQRGKLTPAIEAEITTQLKKLEKAAGATLVAPSTGASSCTAAAASTLPIAVVALTRSV